MEIYDIIIIGGGPAGISAGIYAVSRGKNVVVIEKEKVGGLIGSVSTVTHYAGIMEGETGSTFAARLEKQAKNAGVSIVYETVQKVSLKGEYKTVVTDKGTYQAQKVILANGTTPRKLGIPGEDKLVGRGIGRNAAREGANFSGKHIYVVGGACCFTQFEKVFEQQIGVSVHSAEEAREAVRLGASYLTAGHVFATDCKKGVPPRGLEFLKEICELAPVPVYGIGGIRLDTEQIREVLAQGAAGACIMSQMMRI